MLIGFHRSLGSCIGSRRDGIGSGFGIVCRGRLLKSCPLCGLGVFKGEWACSLLRRFVLRRCLGIGGSCSAGRGTGV